MSCDTLAVENVDDLPLGLVLDPDDRDGATPAQAKSSLGNSLGGIKVRVIAKEGIVRPD
jgi:hypothetical protein